MAMTWRFWTLRPNAVVDNTGCSAHGEHAGALASFSTPTHESLRSNTFLTLSVRAMMNNDD